MKSPIEEALKDLKTLITLLPQDAVAGPSEDDRERIAAIIGLACIPTRKILSLRSKMSPAVSGKLLRSRSPKSARMAFCG